VTAVTRIDQVIPTLASRDAIGGHVMQLRDLLRSRGYASDVFYGNASPDRLDEGFPITRIGDPSSSDRVLLYQLSIGSGVADIFRERSERKFVNYHNITPADLLKDWIPEVGEPQVRFRNPNGKTGKGRRPEVDLEDLESVLESRTSKRAG